MKRRHKKNQKTYNKMVSYLEKSCDEASDCIKNPFRNIKGDETNSEFLGKLGSSEKIRGILQCYDFFAPLSKPTTSNIFSSSRFESFTK